MILLVTGTDTGVGKTVIAGALAIAARLAGRRVAVLKPVETGCKGRPRRAPDAELLARCAGTDPNDAVLWKLRDPVAPAIAADRERVWLPFARIVQRAYDLETDHDVVILEGAGGVRVPITWAEDYASLASALHARTVVVARAGLGTLNHTLLTLEALRASGIHVQGVVLNATTPAQDLATRTNPEALSRLARETPRISVPFLRAKTPLARCRAAARLVAPLL